MKMVISFRCPINFSLEPFSLSYPIRGKFAKIKKMKKRLDAAHDPCYYLIVK
jgi:hypothetical protein